MGDSNQ